MSRTDELKEKYLQPVKTFWEGLDSIKRKIVGIGTAVLLVVIVALVVWLNYQPYVVLFNNLDSDEAAAILQSLQDKGVSAKVENNGTIMVPENQEAALKMQLAIEGYPKGGFTYDIYTNNVDTMATNSDRRTYLMYQLQNRMQEAISTISGIKSAVVTIALPEDVGYVITRNRQEASASVLVTLIGNDDLSASQVEGIKILVARGVLGLKTENVSVINTNTGKEMGGKVDDDDIGANAKDKLAIETEIDEKIERKVLDALEFLVGAGNVHVTATSRINIDGGIVQSTIYTPSRDDNNTGVIGQENHYLQGSNPDVLNGGIPGAETNADVTTYPMIDGEVSDNQFVNQYEYNYWVNEMKEEIQRREYKIESITVSVIINSPDIQQTERARLTDTIAIAANVPTENVVIYFANTQPVQETSGGNIQEILRANWWIVGLIALGVILLIVLIVVLLRRRSKKKKEEDFWAAQDAEAMATLQAQEEQVPPAEETPQQKISRQVREFVDEHPEVAAQLIRTWLKGDG